MHDAPRRDVLTHLIGYKFPSGSQSAVTFDTRWAAQAFKAAVKVEWYLRATTLLHNDVDG